MSADKYSSLRPAFAALLAVLALAAQAPGRVGAATSADHEAGVTDTQILVGTSATFTGGARATSIDMYRGAQAALEVANAAGGIYGRRITLKAYDDGYQPEQALRNTLKLLQQDGVFVLFNYFGTVTVSEVLPLLKKASADNIKLLFPYSGARILRTAPYQSVAYTLTPSYQQEIDGVVDKLLQLGRNRIAVFYQNDAYGRDGWDALRERLAASQLKIVAEATYGRGATYQKSYVEQVAILRAASPDAVLTVGVDTAVAGFIRDVRDAGMAVPIANLRLADLGQMLPLLAASRRPGGPDYGANLIGTTVFPDFRSTQLPAARQYRAAMDKYPSLPPEHLTVTPYQATAYSGASFEGYLNAELLLEVLRRLGPHPSRALLAAAIEGIGGYDLGIGETVSFSPLKHQGRDGIYYNTVIDGVPQALTDWSTWQK